MHKPLQHSMLGEEQSELTEHGLPKLEPEISKQRKCLHPEPYINFRDALNPNTTAWTSHCSHKENYYSYTFPASHVNQ